MSDLFRGIGGVKVIYHCRWRKYRFAQSLNWDQSVAALRLIQVLSTDSLVVKSGGFYNKAA